MPRKKDDQPSHGEKVVILFIKLLFSGNSYSLTELARSLRCSKSTVPRLIDKIRMAYGLNIEEEFRGNRKYFRLKRRGVLPTGVTLSDEELTTLTMCRYFAEHLLGQGQFEEAERALLKSRALSNGGPEKDKLFSSFKPGRIDYTPHRQTIRILLEGMEEKKICRMTYRKILAQQAKTYWIKPLKLFSRKESMYIHARLAREPGKKVESTSSDRLFAVHRIMTVELDDRSFEFPKDYDFEKIFNKTFGVMTGKPFRVVVDFSGKPAEYVAERIWSSDQEITEMENGKIRLSFSSSSKAELLPWVLAFGGDARVIEPDWLKADIQKTCREIIDPS